MMIKRWVSIFFIVIVLLPIAAIILYDQLVVVPYLRMARGIVVHSPYSQRHPPKIIRRMVLVAYKGEYRLRVDTMQTMRRELNIGTNGGMLRSHITGAIWLVLFPLHMNNDDTLALWCSLRPSPSSGLNGLAMLKYGKDLAALNPEEAAVVVALAMRPRWINDPDSGLSDLVQYLLANAVPPT